jgi:hypothetical protein
MAKAMGPFIDLRAPSWLPGQWIDVYRLNPPLIGPVLEDQDGRVKPKSYLQLVFAACLASTQH